MKRADNKKSDAIADEAADWFQVMRDDYVPEKTRERFASWLAQSPVHCNEYLRLVELWEDLGEIDREHRIDVSVLLAEAASESNVAPLFADTDPNEASSRRRRHQAGWLTSFAAALALLGGFLWFSSQNTAVHETYTTSRGEQRSFSLPDGSIIRLNTQSEIRVRLEPDVRRIQLIRGEALFEVVRNPQRPFIVEDNYVVAQALGTRFNIYRRDARTQVTVIEGSVAVSTWHSSSTDLSSGSHITMLSRAELAPGEQAEVGRARALTTSRVDVERVTAWTARRLVFESDRLHDVVEQFNRYNVTELRVADEVLANQRISGTFKADDPEALVSALRSLVDIDIDRRSDGALILQLRSTRGNN